MVPNGNAPDITPTPITNNILVVDDDPNMLTALTMMVTSMGFACHQAMDGCMAVELFEKLSETISLVIMDVEMPHLNGIEATHRLRTIDPKVKVVLVSGHTEQNVWKAKPNAFIAKPFMHIELRRVVDNLMSEVV